MKRQYRYKTAADTKLFFQGGDNFFDNLFNMIPKLNGVIEKTFNKGFLTKIKSLVGWGDYAVEKIKNYVDYFIFPEDAGAQMKKFVNEYQTFFTSVYNYTHQDDYDNLDESKKYCDNLQKTFDEEWKINTDEDGNITGGGSKSVDIMKTLNGIAAASKTIADAVDNPTQFDGSKGFRNKNIKQIKMLVDKESKDYPFNKEKIKLEDLKAALEEISEEATRLKNILINGDYYMVRQSQTGNPGDDLISVWIANTKSEIDKSIVHKQKVKEQQRKKEEGGQQKGEEGKSSGGAKGDKKDESKLGSDEVIKIINEHIRGKYDAAYELIKYYVIKMFDSDRDKLNDQGYEKEGWEQLVNKSFIDFDTKLKERLSEENINVRYNDNTLQSYIENNVKTLARNFNKAFKTLLDLQKSNLISKNSPDIGILEIKSIKDIWNKFIRNTLVKIDAELKGKI